MELRDLFRPCGFRLHAVATKRFRSYAAEVLADCCGARDGEPLGDRHPALVRVTA